MRAHKRNQSGKNILTLPPFQMIIQMRRKRTLLKRNHSEEWNHSPHRQALDALILVAEDVQTLPTWWPTLPPASVEAQPLNTGANGITTEAELERMTRTTTNKGPAN